MVLAVRPPFSTGHRDLNSRVGDLYETILDRLNVGPQQLTYEVLENRAEIQSRQQRPAARGLSRRRRAAPELSRELAPLALALMVSGLLIRFLASGFVGALFRRAGVVVAVVGLVLLLVRPLTWLGEVLRQAPGV